LRQPSIYKDLQSVRPLDSQAAVRPAGYVCPSVSYSSLIFPVLGNTRPSSRFLSSLITFLRILQSSLQDSGCAAYQEINLCVNVSNAFRLGGGEHDGDIAAGFVSSASSISKTTGHVFDDTVRKYQIKLRRSPAYRFTRASRTCTHSHIRS
jgi:hypothetical protein